MKEHRYYVYLLVTRKNGYFYTGVTNDLLRRVYQHKQGLIDGYTKKHRVNILAYYECFSDINEAIKREKLIKKWKRSYKIDAIERLNPQWRDLYAEL